MAAVWDVLQSKMVKRKVPLKNLKPGTIESAAGSSARQVVAIQDGLTERAGQGRRATLEGREAQARPGEHQRRDRSRISGPDKDDLQGAIALLRQHDFGVELGPGNFRSD